MKRNRNKGLMNIALIIVVVSGVLFAAAYSYLLIFNTTLQRNSTVKNEPLFIEEDGTSHDFKIEENITDDGSDPIENSDYSDVE